MKSKSKALDSFKDHATGKSYKMTRDALGHPLLGIVRKEKTPGYRHMSSASRYNSRMHKIFSHAAENKSDPILKSFNRHHRKQN